MSECLTSDSLRKQMKNDHRLYGKIMATCEACGKKDSVEKSSSDMGDIHRTHGPEGYRSIFASKRNITLCGECFADASLIVGSKRIEL